MKNKLLGFILAIVMMLFSNNGLCQVDCGTACDAGCNESCMCFVTSIGECHCSCFGEGMGPTGASGPTEENIPLLSMDDEVNITIKGKVETKELENYLNTILKEGVVVPKGIDTRKLIKYEKSKIKVSSFIEDIGVMTIKEFKNESNRRSNMNFIYGVVSSSLILILSYFFFVRKK